MLSTKKMYLHSTAPITTSIIPTKIHKLFELAIFVPEDLSLADEKPVLEI